MHRHHLHHSTSLSLAQHHPLPFTPNQLFSPTQRITFLAPTHLDIPRPREIIPKLVKTTGHDPVRGVERLLDAIAVVDIDIDVEHSRVMAEEFEDP